MKNKHSVFDVKHAKVKKKEKENYKSFFFLCLFYLPIPKTFEKREK